MEGLSGRSDNLVMSSEDSCSPDESDEELELTLGGYPSSYVASADSVANQPVGWPPIRRQRINSFIHIAKSSATEGVNSEKSVSEIVSGKTKLGGQENNGNGKERPRLTGSLFVKVNMDGSPIGRKVDLTEHSSYESLAQTLEDMFEGPSANAKLICAGGQDDVMATTTTSKLLDGSFDFALTYEDKEGDWMLVGDVPWGMFLSSVKRLRIMRTSEANGLGMLMSKNKLQNLPPKAGMHMILTRAGPVFIEALGRTKFWGLFN